MSIVHVSQIKGRITSIFEHKISLSDVRAEGSERENFFLSRALAAYSLYFLAGADEKNCADAITDGGNDNGIDAIHFDPIKKVFYVVQSKWIHDGSGEPDNGAIKKFCSGVRDLFNLDFDRFNKKIQDKREIIKAALQDHETKYQVVVCYTGSNSLADPSRRDLEDLRTEINDTSEVLSVNVFNQSELYKSLALGASGEPISLKVGLKSWGKVDSPFKAFYGQVNGTEIAGWWEKYQSRLFEKNLRNSLGDTDVNAEIKKTIEITPDHFWYFNNGITIVCKNAVKDMVGGADRDSGTFHCEDISIVNGAQTVSSIGQQWNSKQDARIEKIYVPVRIIAIEAQTEFVDLITKANNRQNRIETRDFVRQDPEQNRIQLELAIDRIQYILMRSDSLSVGPTSFDLIESTTALACATADIKMAVQLKREIGKLWEDITKAPYKELFNGSTSGLYVWRCVQVQRQIDQKLEEISDRYKSGRDYGIAIHGNRIIASMVFRALKASNLKDPSIDFKTTFAPKEVGQAAERSYMLLKELVEKKYPGAMLPTLFKNATKCQSLLTEEVVAH